MFMFATLCTCLQNVWSLCQVYLFSAKLKYEQMLSDQLDQGYLTSETIEQIDFYSDNEEEREYQGRFFPDNRNVIK